MIPQMRNTFVLIQPISRSETKVGAVVIPAAGSKELFSEAVIIAVGPGLRLAEGGVPETHDLFIGQVVLAKTRRFSGPQGQTEPDGFPYRDGVNNYLIVGEGSILAILANSEEDRDAQLAEETAKCRDDIAEQIGLLVPTKGKVIHA